MNDIISIVDKVTKKVDWLVFNTTTNIADKIMSLVGKFTGGKRVKYNKSGFYQRRVLGETQDLSKDPSWHLTTWKFLTEKSPRKLF